MADTGQAAATDDKPGIGGWVVALGGLALVGWFYMGGGPGGDGPLTTESLMADLRDGGVSCASPDIDTMDGSDFRDFGRCETDDGAIDVFVYEDPRANLGGLSPKIGEIYGDGKHAVWGSGWLIVTASGVGHAAELQEAVGGYVQPLGAATTGGTVSTGGSVTGDLDCDSPGVGSNIQVQPGDPHGFDADGDGIGCET